jgi:DNA-binding transcriptional regulator YiaG
VPHVEEEMAEMHYWRPYVPVAQRRAQAAKKMEALRKKGKVIYPVEIDGRTIARSFWGEGWCSHLESFSDYSNRLPRGRTYVRNGSVCHLEVKPGLIEAMVCGSELYKISIQVERLKPALWKAIKTQCAGQVGSILELLQGKLSSEVMRVVTHREEGLFPKPKEIKLSCSCPDWAVMCKHVAAVLYGIGNRLDQQPDLLFLMRGVDAQELISADVALPVGAGAASFDALAPDQLGDIFGVDLDMDTPATPPAAKSRAVRPKAASGGRARAKKKAGRPPKEVSTPRVAKTQAPSPGPSAAKSPKPRIKPSSATIARLRRKLGLTVPEFARRLGVTPATVTRWEAAQGPLSLQSRPLLALDKLHKEAK